MKILCVSNYYFPEHIGGIEVVVNNLVAFYRQAGHEVHWAASDVPPIFRNAGKDDIPLRAWNFAETKLGFPYPICTPGSIPKLWNEVGWCDVIHLHDCLYFSNLLASIFSLIRKKPVLLTQHVKILPYQQAYKRWLQNMAYRLIGRFVFQAAREIVFITPVVRDGMINFIPAKKRTRIIRNGVDTDFYRPFDAAERSAFRREMGLEPGKPLLLFVGRMVERKGVHLLKPIIERHPEWNWILVGRADDVDPKTWNYPNLIHFDRIVGSKMRELYAMSDLLVHPSVGEGITLVAQEAMACGAPVVISEESLHGFDEDMNIFVSTRPEIDALEKSIADALGDEKKMEQLRASARKYAVQTASWANVSRQYLSQLELITKAGQTE